MAGSFSRSPILSGCFSANTRRAYGRAVGRFLYAFSKLYPEAGLRDIRPHHVNEYIEHLTKQYAPATVKQQLAALREFFNWMVISQEMDRNPAQATKGPKETVRRGKTPAMLSGEAYKLLSSIETDTIKGLRDRALIATLLYSWARIEAVLKMNVEDYQRIGARVTLRLHEKGGKYHEVPAHHQVQQCVEAYIEAAGIAEDDKGPLWRSIRARRGPRELSSSRLVQRNTLHMLKKRSESAGLSSIFSHHSCRATAITNFLEHGGTLETAQEIANHADPRTTKLYDRRNAQVEQSEIEKVRYEPLAKKGL